MRRSSPRSKKRWLVVQTPTGYTTDLWTLPRVAEVIERMTGVAYHPGHVWYVLRDQLDWTWQRPARRAVERNEEAIEHWVKKRWPQLKKGRGGRTHYRLRRRIRRLAAAVCARHL